MATWAKDVFKLPRITEFVLPTPLEHKLAESFWKSINVASSLKLVSEPEIE